ncbi:MAG: DUF808 domain-containing protein [Thalassobaculum sp.]|uniref:DUF808 domain-containing protein n=1 Tax=Thalassobaculum sp. TaxID=2022740 RepID=UPI0032EFE2F0
MSSGLIALLDDVAALTKAAAASIDDVAAHTARASAKSAGVVIDDAAVTPRYVVGFAAERELPIVGRIAVGSLRNKLLVLLPAALALGFFAPWAITPLLMLGGAYLCFEGAEKVYEALVPHHGAPGPDEPVERLLDAAAMEDARVAGAIRTDFILSAEIMAITLSAVPDAGFWTQATVLAVVGTGITIGVYGVVAVIVKADDAGVALGRYAAPTLPGRVSRAVGRGIVLGMPAFLQLLATVGTAAMVWVGGGIVVHGLEELGVPWPAHAIETVAAGAALRVPAAADAVHWIVGAAGSGLVGLGLGGALIPVVGKLVVPLWTRLSSLVR